MIRRISLWFVAAALLLPPPLLAQEAATYSGRYSTVLLSQDTLITLDEQMILEQRYVLAQFADDPDSPFNNMTGRCWGSVVFENTNDEEAVSAAGGCHFMDADGSGYYQWWTWEEAGTADCPIRCGRYNDYNGYGRFRGMSGSGTWNLEALLPGESVMGRSVGTVAWR